MKGFTSTLEKSTAPDQWVYLLHYLDTFNRIQSLGGGALGPAIKKCTLAFLTSTPVQPTKHTRKLNNVYHFTLV